jgi:hypoxanthine phosphoribosyltransferase
MTSPQLTTLPIAESIISARVHELAHEIVQAYPPGVPLMLVGILRASFVFLADLSRAINRPALEIEFVSARSYSGTSSSGTVNVQSVGDHPIYEGKHVLLVDTILDTGLTIGQVGEFLKDRGALSVHLCALLRKPHAPRSWSSHDFIGFDIPNEFVVGYGLDANNQQRHQPFISAI